MRYLSLFLILFVLASATVPAAAQTKSRSKGSTQSKTTAPASKTATENTCDGALDIVPSETLSFQRKRRPVSPKPPTTGSTDKKTEN